jgi:hypothetical protein
MERRSMMAALAGLAVTAVAVTAVVTAAGDAPASYSVGETSRAKGPLLAANEGAWKGAAVVSWGPVPYETRFRALWSQRGLFIRFDANDDHPWHTMTRRDQHLWEEEVVEIFLDLDRSGRDYAELEISPGNVVCDVRMVQPWPDKKSDFGWDMAGLETRIVPTPGRKLMSADWTATAFIPWAAFRTLPSARTVQLPPRAGDRWRVNLFRVKRPGGPKAPELHAINAAWSAPGQPSFHVPDAFRDFVFEAPGKSPAGAGR